MTFPAFDLAALNTADPAEQGTAVELENPFTLERLEDTTGVPITWTLRGEDAPSVRAVVGAQADRRNDNINKGRGASLDQRSLDSQQLERLVAATVTYSSNFPPLDGETMQPFSPQNARRILSDKRFRWLVEQLQRELGNRKRFLPKSLNA